MRTRSGRIMLAMTIILPVVLAGYAGGAEEPTRAPLRPVTEREVSPGRGFVQPRLDLSHLTGQQLPAGVTASALPAQWDWRAQGVVTPVKNQGLCGSCYSFAALANFESRILVVGGPPFDFSENNAKECNWYQSSCGGGSCDIMANWLSKTGTVDEICDPYVPSDVACNSSCPYIKTLLDWRIISELSVPSTAVLKQYIYDYGPVYTSFYAGDGNDPDWEDEFNDYDGLYTMYYDGVWLPNHAVLIVGWDDAMPHDGGTGAWIVKNSWGPSWGGTCGYGTEGGYFTLAYGSANIGMNSSFIKAWQDYDSDGDVLFYDEAGATSYFGSGSTTGWGMCKFVMPATAYVYRIEFWTSDITTDVDVYLWDDFTGGTLSTPIDSKLNSSFAEAGYHSVELDSPHELTTGEDFYVAVKFTNNSHAWPIPADVTGPNEMGTTYISSDGSTWTDLGAAWGDDVAIRARTSVDLPVSVADTPEPTPYAYSLSHNYPNPFNPATRISYSLERRSQVQLVVYNILGQRVATLVDEVMPAGQHTVSWNGTDDSGNMLGSGVYFYRFKAGDFTDTKKMVLLK
ncbi:MAG: T9SS type A sorting domain-containing protein [Candidatus Zixiibacteriota bacterium]|nr:MAG: T9SS type A sorting domain-containing protein [candidate division Zixibacteria bacterium]